MVFLQTLLQFLVDDFRLFFPMQGRKCNLYLDTWLSPVRESGMSTRGGKLIYLISTSDRRILALSMILLEEYEIVLKKKTTQNKMFIFGL